MKSLQRSCGKFFPLVFTLVFSGLAAGLVGCSTTDGDEKNASSKDELGVSLADDRKELEELRKNIPEEKRQENDQLREILALMGEVKLPPATVRERFNRTTHKMRQSHTREMTRKRNEFNKAEKKKRDDYFKKLKKDRDNFTRRKVDREERKEFFDKQDEDRREFTADERDRRNQFNADMKVANDDFNTLMRDKNNEFNQEYRAYTQRYNEYQKHESTKPQTGGASSAPKSPLDILNSRDNGP